MKLRKIILILSAVLIIAGLIPTAAAAGSYVGYIIACDENGKPVGFTAAVCINKDGEARFVSDEYEVDQSQIKSYFFQLEQDKTYWQLNYTDGIYELADNSKLSEIPCLSYNKSVKKGDKLTLQKLKNQGEFGTESTQATVTDIQTEEKSSYLILDKMPSSENGLVVAIGEGDSFIGIMPKGQDTMFALAPNEDGDGATDGSGKSGMPSGMTKQAICVIIGVVVLAIAAIVYFKKKQPNTASDISVIPSEPVQYDIPTDDSMFETADFPTGNTRQTIQQKTGYSLVCHGGHLDGRVYPFSGGEMLFGRLSSCAIQYPAEEKGVSRSHCKLYSENGQLKLVDLNSAYGTYLKRLGKLMPNSPVIVSRGDKFYIGNKLNGILIQ